MELKITEFANRKTPVGSAESYTWDELKKKLRRPVITEELIDEYREMSNEKRTAIKDVGGYVGGELKNGKRSKATLMNRCLLTIDADDATTSDVDDYRCLYENAFFVHTTHTSTVESPRLRWVFPLSRTVTANEYKYLVGIVKHWVGAESIDETTDQPERLMFWPSVSLDADYQYWEGGTEIIDPDVLLDGVDVDAEEYKDTPVTRILPEDELISEGGRNRAVFNFAANLRQSGLGNEPLFQMVTMFNESYCDPPLPAFEIKTICASVAKYQKGEKIPIDVRKAADDFSDVGSWDDPNKKKVTTIEAISAAALDKKDIPEMKFVVPGLIPTGLVIVASPPKFGKSWFCMDLVLSVATGTPFLGFETNRCDALYLALEDSEKRLQNRIRKVADGRSIPEEAHFCIEAPTLAEGLLPAVENYIKLVPKIGLVVIDTLQKVRGVAGKTEGVYGYDYRELGELQKFALAHDLSVVLVHHTNKNSDSDDFINSMNGSMGISGAADEMLIMKRDKRRDQFTTLQMSGRDIMDKDYILTFNATNCRWNNIGESKDVVESQEEIEYRTNPFVETIRYKLDEISELSEEFIITYRCTAKQLLDETIKRHGDKNLETNAASGVGRLVAKYADLMFKHDGISFETDRESASRFLVFIRER